MRHKPLEFFVNEKHTSTGYAASAYFDFSSGFGEKSISCLCGNPYACECELVDYPHEKLPGMRRNEFKDPRPFLLYTIQRFDGDPVAFMYTAKVLTDVKKEINRLNAKLDRSMMEWYYIEEKEYNEAVKAEHRQYMNEME